MVKFNLGKLQVVGGFVSDVAPKKYMENAASQTCTSTIPVHVLGYHLNTTLLLVDFFFFFFTLFQYYVSLRAGFHISRSVKQLTSLIWDQPYGLLDLPSTWTLWMKNLKTQSTPAAPVSNKVCMGHRSKPRGHNLQRGKSPAEVLQPTCFMPFIYRCSGRVEADSQWFAVIYGLVSPVSHEAQAWDAGFLASHIEIITTTATVILKQWKLFICYWTNP